MVSLLKLYEKKYKMLVEFYTKKTENWFIWLKNQFRFSKQQKKYWFDALSYKKKL